MALGYDPVAAAREVVASVVAQRAPWAGGASLRSMADGLVREWYAVRGMKTDVADARMVDTYTSGKIESLKALNHVIERAPTDASAGGTKAVTPEGVRAWLAAKTQEVIDKYKYYWPMNKAFGVDGNPFGSVNVLPSASELMVLQKFEQAYGTQAAPWLKPGHRCGYGVNPRQPNVYWCKRIKKGVGDYNAGTFFESEGSGPVPGLSDAADVALAVATIIPGIPPFP